MVLFGQLKKTPKKIKFVDRIYSFLFDKLPYRVSQYIKLNGDKRIEEIVVYRTPIVSVINKLFNILSLGRFNEMKNKLGYDDIYHLYMVVKFNDDTYAIIEKNQDINIGEIPMNRQGGQAIKIDMKEYQPTLNELLEKTKKVMGESKFYGYQSFTNNCQDFIYNVINSNGLMTPEYASFIKQDASSLLKSLPEYTASISNTTTQGASYINRFLQSIGLKGFEEGGIIY